MPVPSKPEAGHSLTFQVSVDQLNFKWQMFFNIFSIEKHSAGCLLRVAYVHQGVTTEIVPVIVSKEGLQQLKESSAQYIQSFDTVPPRQDDILSTGRQFSPFFANYVRLANNGNAGEIAFFTIPIYRIVDAGRGKITKGEALQSVQVALLHSDLLTHKQLTLALLSQI